MKKLHEKDLLETTFDGVAELLGTVDACIDAISGLKKRIDVLTSEIKVLKEMWQ